MPSASIEILVRAHNDCKGYPRKGQESDASTPRVNGTGIAELATGFGLALKRGTDPREVAVGHVAGNVLGISLREANHEALTRPSDGTTEYAITQSVSMMREGYINVEVTVRAAVEGAFLNVVDLTGEFTGGTAVAGETLSVNVVAMEDGLVGEIIRARIDIK